MRGFVGVLLAGLSSAPVVADVTELYGSLCATCHGAQGEGDGPGVPDNMIRPRPFSAGAFKFDTDADWQKGTDTDLANVIRNGTQAYGGSPLMPPWSDLSDEDVMALVAYIRSFRPNPESEITMPRI